MAHADSLSKQLADEQRKGALERKLTHKFISNCFPEVCQRGRLIPFCFLFDSTPLHTRRRARIKYLLATVNTAKLGMEHAPSHFPLTREVSGQTGSILQNWGMSRQPRLLAFLVNTVYKVQTTTAPLLIPQIKDFGGVGVLPITHTLLRWDECIPKQSWI